MKLKDLLLETYLGVNIPEGKGKWVALRALFFREGFKNNKWGFEDDTTVLTVKFKKNVDALEALNKFQKEIDGMSKEPAIVDDLTLYILMTDEIRTDTIEAKAKFKKMMDKKFKR